MTLRARTALVALAAFAILAPPVYAGGTPFADINTPSGPLTRVIVGNELSCQVAYAGDSAFELYPSATTPGDCGTFIVAGDTLYSPNLAAHGSSAASAAQGTPFTPVSQSGVTGSGSGSDPKRVVTVATAGSLEITETDSYITGQEAYRTDVAIRNTGGTAATGRIYRAGDCYLQESDQGFGFLDTGANAAGCSLNANNAPPARIEQWYPLTAGAKYFQSSFGEVWAAIGAKGEFPNTCRCTEARDNGAGIQWDFNIAPGATATFSHLTVFSPRGVAGPPPPPSGTGPQTGPTGDNAQIFGPNGIVNAPSNRRCVSRRNFKIRLRNPIGTEIVAAVVRVNGRRVATRRGVRTTARVDLRGLPKGRYTVSITILLDNDRTIRGKRKYRTCGKVRRRGRVPRV